MPPDALVLGFDTSASHCGAALLSGGECVAARHEDMGKGQAERLMPLLEEVLAEAGVTWADLEALGVGVGPGNFTGIRISVAAARGLALGLKVPAVGVSLLNALGYGTEGPVLACLDARRGQGYFQRQGYGDPEPFIAAIEGLTEEAPPNLRCIGGCAADVAKVLGAEHVPARYAPGVAIARIAAERMDGPVARPAPYYLRPVDAKPPSEPPPTLLA